MRRSRASIIVIPLVAVAAVAALYLRGRESGDEGGLPGRNESAGIDAGKGAVEPAVSNAPESPNSSAASSLDLPVPSQDTWNVEFKQWETATYRPILDQNGELDQELAAESVSLLPVELFTPIDEKTYDALLSRVSDLLLLYATRDAQRYLDFFEKGGSVPQPERVKMYRSELLREFPDLRGEDLRSAADVFGLNFESGQSKSNMNPWSGLNPELSKITVKSSGPNLSLTQEMQTLPNQGVISTHLQWDHPRNTEQLAGSEGKVTYAVVQLQIQHENSGLAFPLTFLFYWDGEAGTWQLKEGYARYGKDVKHRIQM